MPINTDFLNTGSSDSDSTADLVQSSSKQAMSALQDMGLGVDEGGYNQFRVTPKAPPAPIAAPPKSTPESMLEQITAARAAVVNMQEQQAADGNPDRGLLADWWEQYGRSKGTDLLASTQNSIADNVKDPEQRRELHKYIAELTDKHVSMQESDPIKADSMMKQFFLGTANPTILKSMAMEVGKEAAIQAALHLTGTAEFSGETLAAIEAARSTRTLKGMLDAARLGWKGAHGVANAANIVGSGVINYATWGRQISGELKTEMIKQNPGVDMDILDHATDTAGLLGASVFSVGMPKALKQYLKPAFMEAAGAGVKNGIKNAFKETVAGAAKMEGAMVASDLASRWQMNDASRTQKMRDIERGVIGATSEKLNDPKYAVLEGWDLVQREWQVAKDSIPMALGMGIVGGVARGVGEVREAQTKLAKEADATSKRQVTESAEVAKSQNELATKSENAINMLREKHMISPVDLDDMTASEIKEKRDEINQEFRDITGQQDVNIIEKSKAGLFEFFNTTPEEAAQQAELHATNSSLNAWKEMKAHSDARVSELADAGMDWKDNKRAIQLELNDIADKHGVKHSEGRLAQFVEEAAAKDTERRDAKSMGKWKPLPQDATIPEKMKYHADVMAEYNKQRAEINKQHPELYLPPVEDTVNEAKLKDYAKIVAGVKPHPELVAFERDQKKQARDFDKSKKAQERANEKAAKEKAAKDKKPPESGTAAGPAVTVPKKPVSPVKPARTHVKMRDGEGVERDVAIEPDREIHLASGKKGETTPWIMTGETNERGDYVKVRRAKEGPTGKLEPTGTVQALAVADIERAGRTEPKSHSVEMTTTPDAPNAAAPNTELPDHIQAIVDPVDQRIEAVTKRLGIKSTGKDVANMRREFLAEFAEKLGSPKEKMTPEQRKAALAEFYKHVDERLAEYEKSKKAELPAKEEPKQLPNKTEPVIDAEFKKVEAPKNADGTLATARQQLDAWEKVVNDSYRFKENENKKGSVLGKLKDPYTGEKITLDKAVEKINALQDAVKEELRKSRENPKLVSGEKLAGAIVKPRDVVAPDGTKLNVPIGGEVKHGSLRDVLAQASKDKKHGYMMNRLAELLGKLPGTDKIDVVYTNDPYRSAGLYRSKLNSIEINLHYLEKHGAEIPLHEAIHAATHKAILQGIHNLESLTPEQQSGWKQLEKLWRAHREDLALKLENEHGNKQGAAQVRGSMWEFVSYALTHKEAYDYLSSIKEPTTMLGNVANAFKAMVEHIAKLIGLPQSNALTELMDSIAKSQTAAGASLEAMVKLASTRSDFSYDKMKELENAKIENPHLDASPTHPAASNLEARRLAIEDPIGHSYGKLRDMALGMMKNGLPISLEGVKTRMQLIDRIFGSNSAMPDWAVHAMKTAVAADKVGSMLEHSNVHKLKNVILNAYSNASTAFARLSEEMGKELSTDLVHAGVRASNVQNIAKAIFPEIRSLWKQMNGDKGKVDLVINHQQHSLQEAERLNLAIQMRNATDRDFIKNNGFATEEGKKVIFGFTKEEKEKNFAAFEKQVQYAAGSHGDMIARKMLEVTKKMGELIEPIAKEYYGKDFKRIDNYWRRFVSHPPEMKNQFGEVDNGMFNRFGNWNPLKERTGNSNAMTVKNAFSVFNNMVNESSNFVGHAQLVSKWRRIINNKSMIDAIQTKMGDKYRKQLLRHLANIEGIYDKNGLPLVNNLFRFQDVARFSNPFVAIKQFANTPNIAVMFSVRDWMKSLRSLPQQDINTYLNGSGGAYLKYRLESQMQTPELFEHMEQQGARAVLGDTSALNKMRNASTALIRWSDNYTVKQTITAAASFVERMHPELKGDDKIAAVNYAASEALFKLQPVGERGWKVDLASRGTAGRLATRYQHVPLAMFNQMQRAGMTLARHPKDVNAQIDFVKTIAFGAVASGAILAGADFSKEKYYNWVAQNYGHEDEKKEAKNLKDAVARFKWTWAASSADVLPAGRMFSGMISGFFTALETGDASYMAGAQNRVGQDMAFGSQFSNLARILTDTVRLKNNLQNQNQKTGKQWMAHDEARRKAITRITNSSTDLFSETFGIPLGSMNKLTGASHLIP